MIALKNSVFKKLGFAGGTNYTGIVTDSTLIVAAYCYETKREDKYLISLSVPLRFRNSYKERNTETIYHKAAAILLKN
jgi:hypothetical protein